VPVAQLNQLGRGLPSVFVPSAFFDRAGTINVRLLVNKMMKGSFKMRIRNLLAVVALVTVFTAAITDADAGSLNIYTGAPKGAATAASPYTLVIDNGDGTTTTVNVTGISPVLTPTSDDKAAVIRAAIPAIYKPTGLANRVSFNGAGVTIAADPTKETYDKLGAGVFKASMTFSGTSTGTDPLGGTSTVQAGIDTIFVDNLTLTSGMGAGAICTELSQDLTNAGISNTATIISATDATLAINNPIYAPSNFVFGDSDTGMNITATITSVPEPGTVILLGMGVPIVLAISAYARHRRRRVGGNSRVTAGATL
jgi:hypothetical protein